MHANKHQFALVAVLVSLSGCETTAEFLSGVADEMSKQQQQQPQQQPVRRSSDTSARGTK